MNRSQNRGIHDLPTAVGGVRSAPHMVDAIWTAVFIGVAGIGAALLVVRRSRMWMAAGLAYVLGGIGYATHSAIHLAGAFEPPFDSAAVDVAVWFGVIGFFALLAGALLTLIAIGRRGRRRFLVAFAAATLAIATYQFWTTNWVARFGQAEDRCFDSGHFASRANIQRVPPGVRCFDRGNEVFVAADGISWLALAGWSVFYGFVASFPLMGLAWAVRQRPLPGSPRAQV
jgi:hypothetical protein